MLTQLSTRLEKMPEPFASEAWKKENEPLIRELENQVKNPPADPKLTMELVGKLQAKQAEDEARLVTQTQSRQETATRLSYLQGDDAVRAKVRWLLMDKEDGSGDATGDVMLHGLAQSRNLQLQLQLLQAAWDDTWL